MNLTVLGVKEVPNPAQIKRAHITLDFRRIKHNWLPVVPLDDVVGGSGMTTRPSSSVPALIKPCTVPYQTGFPPPPSCPPATSTVSSRSSSPLNAARTNQGERRCGDSSCMTEEKVIKRRRPKEEVWGPSELLPPKRTHRVLGTGNFSQGGSAWSMQQVCVLQTWTCLPLGVFFVFYQLCHLCHHERWWSLTPLCHAYAGLLKRRAFTV